MENVRGQFSGDESPALETIESAWFLFWHENTLSKFSNTLAMGYITYQPIFNKYRPSGGIIFKKYF